MIANYLRLIVFALGLLVGVQVPGFVDQYAKRVSAHHSEVAKNVAGFQETADRYFSGSIEALIAHHVASADSAFRDEAGSIRQMYDRLTALRAELAALRGPLIKQIVHVLVHPNREILDETRSEYTYAVTLSPAAVVSGLTAGAVLAMLVEALFSGLVRLLRPHRGLPRRAISAR
jgi:Protein of unknown function (DUF2937)